MRSWSLEDAQKQFEIVVEYARTDGPQFITSGGEEIAVVLGIDEYRRLVGNDRFVP